MDITGITRLKDGKEVDEFVVGHAAHGYWYKGVPPLTHGCRECWAAFFTAQWALSGSKKEDVDRLESAIRHVTEQAAKGKFDFKPEYEFSIEHDATD